MARISDPRNRNQHPEIASNRLRLVHSAAPSGAKALPAVVPLLRPDQPVTPAQETLLSGIAQRARLGDWSARDLLWRAFAARLEPALVNCARMTWHVDWVRRNGRPWELDDLRQEAWLVFADLAAKWDGEGSFVPYIMAYFPWRLRNAMRHLRPSRRAVARARVPERFAECDELLDAEGVAMVFQIMARLSPEDAEVLWLRVMEGQGLSGIARRLGVSRRTVTRRWSRIEQVGRETLAD
jgi:RNA polymerase sigma factor (sigma-70 family)